jgi:hypothetical protein
MSNQSIDIICAALLAIVHALRKEYNRPDKTGVIIVINERDTIAGVTGYTQETKTGI